MEKGAATYSSNLAWRIPWTVHGVAKSRTQLSDFHFLNLCSVTSNLLIVDTRYEGIIYYVVFCGSDGKESACSAGDPGSIPGSERFPGEGNGNPLQYSAREIPGTEEPGRVQSMGSQSQIWLRD